MSFTASPEGLKYSASSSNSPIAPPATAPTSRIPDNPSSRSCVTCRRRKVRCNKRSPCSNCAKSGIECVFPPPGRAPRKSKRPPDTELLSRLRHLEGVIGSLSGKNGEGSSTTTTNTTPPKTTASTYRVASTPVKSTAASAAKESGVACPFEPSDPRKPDPGKFENEFGRLVIDEGKSRYVSNRLWASLGDEIEELQDILDHSSSDEDDVDSPESAHSGSHDGFLLGFSSISLSLKEYHPPLPRVSKFWEIYMENVAPLISILHAPSTRSLLIEAAQKPESLDKNSEALVFSIYLTAIISLSADDCLKQLGEDRGALYRRYRFAVEQALSRANLLNTQSLVLLQAAVLFLISVRREDDSKFVWSMTSVVLRLAQGLGLHRDGTHFSLKPFETEMRRRLWWHICFLDIRAAEDHATDPLIHESMFDTRLPLNVNDDDLQPEMTEAPKEREGCTDVTFSLIRAEITGALRKVNYGCPLSRFGVGSEARPPPIEFAERMIQIISRRIEERYIKHCDKNIPIQWAAATVGRIILAKLWLIVHHPLTRKDRITTVSNSTRQSLFLTSIEVLEFGRLLEADPKTAKWSWLFRTNMQWHGVAFVLSEICVRTICPVTDRAWNAVTLFYKDWKMKETHKKGMLWRPLDALMKRAASTRAQQKQELLLKYGPNSNALIETPPCDLKAMYMNSLPHIHMPEDSAKPSPFARTVQTTNQNQSESTSPDPLDVSINGGPWETLQIIFPGTNILAPVPYDNPPPRTPSPANTSAPPPPPPLNLNLSTPLPPPPPIAANPTINPLISQGLQPEEEMLNWEDWDQVMRDFQMDVRNDDPGLSNGNGVFTEWLV
ncbi:hypothetical protein N7495_005451 [Penicillium taxi]|uniref:uncharacterized protein n=1 Tax=Penicillium taxi TaxID=168475 RepID=UPI0025453894|nr:uncharacterized protein N7495_005451 [Penicillium taxi]KAJ5893760.1 hypothetical protein N7495_005451 [Penicillium taxi]